MPLFSSRAQTSVKARPTLPAASTSWQKSVSRGLSSKNRRASIPPWLINTGSLIIMGSCFVAYQP
ncbi:hypothetical protein [Psychrobacter glacincola]|uniref:hypothetical protein n=1 Tax=Psychrobacter glacincola TaxID=56810 RepID=UPI003D068B3A